jgi:single-strand DNA-binding protein
MLPLVTLEGRLAADPELRFSTSGLAIGSLRMVTSSRKKNDAGEWVDDKTLWIDVTCFGRVAENTIESTAKGDLLTVVGRLQTENWETKEGEKRSKIALVADSIAASLAFRTIPHGAGKAERSSGKAPDRPADDPWASQPASSTAGGFSDDPPF